MNDREKRENVEAYGIRVKGLGMMPVANLRTEIDVLFATQKQALEVRGGLNPMLVMSHKKLGRGVISLDFSSTEQKKKQCFIISMLLKSMKDDLEMVLFVSDVYYRKVDKNDIEAEMEKKISEQIDSKEALLVWGAKPSGEYISKTQEYMRIGTGEEKEIIWGECHDLVGQDGVQDNMFGQIWEKA